MPESLAHLQKNIIALAPPGSQPKIIIVTKQQSAEKIVPFLREGHIDFGENRVQEAEGKWPALRAQFPNITLHCIGPLQSNKVKKAVVLFDVIASVDRPDIAKKIAEECQKQNKNMRLFIQVNIGREPQKHGVLPEELHALLSYCQKDLQLTIEGLQAIPPQGEVPDPYFAELKKLAEINRLEKVSMGMSSDYETAVKMGTDYIRIGSLLFGVRRPNV